MIGFGVTLRVTVAHLDPAHDGHHAVGSEPRWTSPGNREVADLLARWQPTSGRSAPTDTVDLPARVEHDGWILVEGVVLKSVPIVCPGWRGLARSTATSPMCDPVARSTSRARTARRRSTSWLLGDRGHQNENRRDHCLVEAVLTHTSRSYEAWPSCARSCWLQAGSPHGQTRLPTPGTTGCTPLPGNAQYDGDPPSGHGRRMAGVGAGCVAIPEPRTAKASPARVDDDRTRLRRRPGRPGPAGAPPRRRRRDGAPIHARDARGARRARSLGGPPRSRGHRPLGAKRPHARRNEQTQWASAPTVLVDTSGQRVPPGRLGRGLIASVGRGRLGWSGRSMRLPGIQGHLGLRSGHRPGGP